MMILPFFGAVLFGFTQSNLGHRVLKKKLDQTISDTMHSLDQDEETWADFSTEHPAGASLAKYVNRSGCFPVYERTNVTYFPSGEAKFQAMLAELEKAEHFIFLEYFIIAEGTMWGQVLEILARKVQEGVDVRLMYDGNCEFFTLPHNYPEKIRALGIKCKVFAPLAPVLSTHYNYRDHRKILVIDGHTAFNGGVNLADEYINHISADIYGDAGVQRAAAYDFKKVDESYFDDALFIGDSRTVGLYDYTDLPEHADFLCETSLTIYKVMGENFKGKGTVEEVLAAKNYGKIYIMMGINELGRGTTEDFMQKYTEVVDTLHELAPEAKIIIEANMRVSGKKSSSDAIFNNSNINARNNAIATLADNETFFYIDMNEAVCDENGDLNAEYTHDQIHLLGKYNELWKQFLMEHGV